MPIHSRRAALLIIVTGLAALVLSLGVAFLGVMRADGRHTLAVIQDAQARVMLAAAKAYLLESSRLGWGEQETLGWNDIRNHAVGPIRIDRDPWSGPADEPTHRVWTANSWPAPGSTMRAAMHVWQRPPFAVRQGPRNPILVHATAADLVDGRGIHDHPTLAGNVVLVTHEGQSGSYSSLNDVWRLGSLRHRDPEPVVDPVVDPLGWRQGDPLPRVRTQHLAWFRIYRETAADHDGDGDPYYDVIDCNGGTSPGRSGEPRAHPPNASIFLITCGAGASLGFRDWTEVVAAGAAAVFNHDESQFRLVRGAESLLWFRVEWSPFNGDHSAKGRRQGQILAHNSGFAVSNHLNTNIVSAVAISPSHFGSILWTQRLDREPPRW